MNLLAEERKMLDTCSRLRTGAANLQTGLRRARMELEALREQTDLPTSLSYLRPCRVARRLLFFERTLNELVWVFHAIVSRHHALLADLSVLSGDKGLEEIEEDPTRDSATLGIVCPQGTPGSPEESFDHCPLLSISPFDVPASSKLSEGTLSDITTSLPHPACRPGACIPLLKEKAVSLEARSVAFEKNVERILHGGVRNLDA